MGVRQEVMADLVQAADEEIAAGRWAPDALRERFPGLPETIAYEAWMQAYKARSAGEESRWWERVERTIDGEIVRKALTAE